MFLPEYTITPNILKNIASIEYNRSFIENSNILPNFEKRLEKEAKTAVLVSSLKHLGELPNQEVIKKYVDGLTKLHSPIIVNISNALHHIENLATTYEIEEKDIKFLHSIISKSILPVTRQGLYRSAKIPNKVEPETILAEINDLVDWYNGLDAKETNPIVVAALIKGQLEIIQPFERFSHIISNLCSRMALLSKSYYLERYINPEGYYITSERAYEQNLTAVVKEDGDFTAWLEYFTEGIATQIATLAEKVKLYAKDTKLAKANGRIDLTKRQETIVEFLQDYGMLKNQQFDKLFPDISEDSVLRDLKKLTDAGIVVKRGKTKSSRYELR